MFVLPARVVITNYNNEYFKWNLLLHIECYTWYCFLKLFTNLYKFHGTRCRYCWCWENVVLVTTSDLSLEITLDFVLNHFIRVKLVFSCQHFTPAIDSLLPHTHDRPKIWKLHPSSLGLKREPRPRYLPPRPPAVGVFNFLRI